MGVLVDSPGMAGALAAFSSEMFPLVSYVPELTPDGGLAWEEAGTGGAQVRHSAEPDTTPLSRLFLWLLGLLPIEWLL